MRTTATNRKIRELLTSLRDEKIIPRPDFQRRLVWSNKDKAAFLETVLLSYPFPEIYVAAGEVDLVSGEAKELLVDGQQRLTTLLQYFLGSPDLKLTPNVPPYNRLSDEQKQAFLQYDVVVRDLGAVPIELVRDVFRRINATKYGLNAMEIHNARYAGEYKAFAEEVAQKQFFDDHHVFGAAEIRRMQDTRFVLTLVTTLLSTYFNRDDEVESFLENFNDEFPIRGEIERELDAVLSFIDRMQLPDRSRAWKKADLFTLVVELHRALIREGLDLQPQSVAIALEAFYREVDAARGAEEASKVAVVYGRAALQASNDRSNRLIRGEIIAEILRSTLNRDINAQTAVD